MCAHACLCSCMSVCGAGEEGGEGSICGGGERIRQMLAGEGGLLIASIAWPVQLGRSRVVSAVASASCMPLGPAGGKSALQLPETAITCFTLLQPIGIFTSAHRYN